MKGNSLTKRAAVALATAILAASTAASAEELTIFSTQWTTAITESVGNPPGFRTRTEAWAKTSHHEFKREPETAADRSYEGGHTLASIGFSRRTEANLIVGLAINRVDTGAESKIGAHKEDVDTEDLIFTPYVAYPVTPQSTIWSAIGYGTGSLESSGDVYGKTDADTKLMAVGFLSEVHQAGPVAVELDGYAFLLDYESERYDLAVLLPGGGTVTRTVPEGDYDIARLRLGLGVSGAKRFTNNATMNSKAGIGLRYDEGDEEEGLSIDLNADIVLNSPGNGYRIAAGLDWLLHHNEDEYEEWGLNLGFTSSF